MFPCIRRLRTDWDALGRVRWQAEDTLDPEARLRARSAAWWRLDTWMAAQHCAREVA